MVDEGVGYEAVGEEVFGGLGGGGDERGEVVDAV